MKIIKLGSNAVAGKDYTLEVPVVVKPAVIRYVSRNLKDLAKSNPDLAIVYTDEQYANLPASIKKKLEDPETGLLTSEIVEMETAVNPAEEFAGEAPSNDLADQLFVSSLTNGLDDLTALVDSQNLSSFKLADKVVISSSESAIYQNYHAAALPVRWLINGKEDIASMINTLPEGVYEATSNEVEDNGITISKYTDKEENLIGYTLDFDFASPDGNGDQINSSFLLTAIIDMNGAEFFEDSSNLTSGTVIESPLFKDWKKTFNFEVVIHGNIE
ncbi:MAG: hypothetical protein J6Y02_04780 [Pseudobutyrivibrio sp.]|nr:hypothetical protein [Pseudobutyrivibrio sp.]